LLGFLERLRVAILLTLGTLTIHGDAFNC